MLTTTTMNKKFSQEIVQVVYATCLQVTLVNKLHVLEVYDYHPVSKCKQYDICFNNCDAMVTDPHGREDKANLFNQLLASTQRKPSQILNIIFLFQVTQQLTFPTNTTLHFTQQSLGTLATLRSKPFNKYVKAYNLFTSFRRSGFIRSYKQFLNKVSLFFNEDG